MNTEDFKDAVVSELGSDYSFKRMERSEQPNKFDPTSPMVIIQLFFTKGSSEDEKYTGLLWHDLVGKRDVTTTAAAVRLAFTEPKFEAP